MDRSRRAARFVVRAAMIAATACSREESLDQAPPARTAPWVANEGPSPKPAQELAHYQLLPEGEVAFEIPRRPIPIRGRFRNFEGKLIVDQGDLARSRATVRLDLSSVEVEPTDAPTGSTARLLESLGLGTNISEPASEQVRWARVEVTELRDLSSRSVSFSSEFLKESSPRTAIAQGDAGHSMPHVVRTVTGQAVTSLDLNMRRTQAPVSLRAVFEFPGLRRQSGSRATALEIATVAPMVVSLEAHGLRPTGAIQTRRTSARIAKVSFVLRAQLVEP